MPAKLSEQEKYQRREQRYAAMGPNCPNGHPRAEYERIERGYRSCCACRKERFDRRVADGSFFVGTCPKGHAFTKDNTVLVPSQFTRMCLICKRATSARARVVKLDLMPRILELARQGASINALLGRGPKRLEKALVPNSVTLTRLTTLKTPEGRELKQLFAQNRQMGHAMKAGVNAWLPDRREFLAELLTKSGDSAAITAALNDHFGSSHSERNVRHHIWKWGLSLRQRSPALIAGPSTLRLPPGSLLEGLVSLLPNNLARDQRDDLISEIAAMIYGRLVPEAFLEINVRQLISRSFKQDHDQWGAVSLDLPIVGTTLRLGDTVTRGLWSDV